MKLYVYEMTFKKNKGHFFSNNRAEKATTKYYLFNELDLAQKHAISRASKNVESIKFYVAELTSKSYSSTDDVKSRELNFSTREPAWITNLEDLEELTLILNLVYLNHQWIPWINNPAIVEENISDNLTPTKNYCRLL